MTDGMMGVSGEKWGKGLYCICWE